MSLTSSSTSDNDFSWRHATIQGGVTYPSPFERPLSRHDGQISSWTGTSNDGGYPFSFPKHTSAIFASNSVDNPHLNDDHDTSIRDKYGFSWAMSENYAREFLKKSYPEIYKKEIETFKYRHATIAPGVHYRVEKFCPHDIYNGLIVSWGPVNGLFPFSYPTTASPIFKPDSLREKRSAMSERDHHGFSWDITEEEAREFLQVFYPTIFEKFQEEDPIATTTQTQTVTYADEKNSSYV